MESSRTHFEVLGLGLEGQVLVNWPVLGSRTALFFELLKFCEALEKFFGKRFFCGDRLKNFCEDLFFGEHLRLCPWPRECLSSERLSLASDFFCVLGLGSSLVSSTPPLLVKLEKRSKSCLVFVTWIHSGNRLLRHLKGPWKKVSLKANCCYGGRNSAGRITVGTNKNVLLKANFRYSRCRNIQFLLHLPFFSKQS